MDTNISRKFTGKLSGFSDKVQRNFYKKALKAYIRGKSEFAFGINPNDLLERPMKYKTPQKYFRRRL